MSKGKITERQLHESVLKLIEDNSVRLVHKKSSTTISTVAEKIAINIPEYDKNTDILMVYENSTYIEEGDDYTISEDGMYILSTNGNWNTFEEKTTFNFVTIKSIPKMQSGDVITCVITVQSTDWEYSEEECLYYKDVVHNLGTDHLFVSGKDPDTKDSIEVMVRYTDENNIRIYNEAETNIMINLVSAKTENNLIINKIDDMHVKEDTTWSSNKIRNQITAVNTRITENMNEVNKQFTVIDSKLDEITERITFSEKDMIDYMGEQHNTLKNVNDSNVEYLLRRVNTQKYEGSNITTTNTYAKQINSIILKGISGYKDIDTGELLDSFKEGKNLEIVESRAKNITSLSTLNLLCIEEMDKNITVKDSFSCKYSNYISVIPREVLWFNMNGKSIYTWAVFYNSNKVQIEEILVAGHSVELGFFDKYSYQVPADAVFMRLLIRQDNEQYMMCNRGDDYIPYVKGVPYKSSIIDLSNQTIHLNGLNDIKEEMDIINGKIMRKFEYLYFNENKNFKIENVETNTSNGLSRIWVRHVSDNKNNYSRIHRNTMNGLLPCYSNLEYSAYTAPHECITRRNNGSGLNIIVKTDRVESPTKANFEIWLQENMPPILYDLKTEFYHIESFPVFEQTLYSYDSTTYYSCTPEKGYLTPILSLEVPTDLASLVGSQQIEIDTLTQENKELKEVNKEQDELINTSLLATDEMYMMLEPILEPLLVNTLSDNNTYMTNMYIKMVQRKLKKIEEVPLRFREQVREALEGSQE